MQPIINTMAVAGFALSTSITAALVISYMQFDSFMDESMERISGKVTSAVESELNGKLDGVVKQIPTQTGPAIPFAKP